MPSRMGVYTIVNLLDDKQYVGGSKSLATRFATHKRDLKHNRHRNPGLQSAYNEYGSDAFEFRVLEIVEDRSQLLAREEHWINSLGCRDKSLGYNLITEGDHRTHADETRQRMSRSHTGQTFTAEHRARIGAAHAGKKRGPLTEEQRAKISAALKGRKLSPETKQRVSAAKKGRPGVPNSPEARAKISAANKGVPKSAEHRARISSARKGQKLSPDRYAKLLQVQRHRSAETRAKLSESNGKLTPDQVREIRQKASIGQKAGDLAREYAVSPTTVSDLLKGRTWRHVT